MSIDVSSLNAAAPRRRRVRAAATARPDRDGDALNPARGLMVGLGLSAVLWAGIGALILR